MNAILRRPDGSLLGDMFDGTGFVRGVERKGRQLKGAKALVVGSGGVGSAIAASLAAAGIDTIFLLSPTTTDDRIRRASELGGGFLCAAQRLGGPAVGEHAEGRLTLDLDPDTGLSWQALKDAAKTNPFLIIKGGSMGGKSMSAKDIDGLVVPAMTSVRSRREP